MNLSLRLETVANLVDENKVVADIGCDHALLSIYLVENKRVSKVYAIDNKKGPLAKANENILLHGKEKQIQTILSDGLTNLPDDVDVAVMAGIGGLLAIQMLEKAKRLPHTIIIQANNHLKELREYLSNHGFKIIEEKILLDSGIYYEIIKVREGIESLNENDLVFGPILRKERSDYFINKWTAHIEHLNYILNKNEKNIDQLDDVKSFIELIKDELK